MSLQLFTAPTEEPVDVEEMKAHVRADNDDEDVLLEQMIVAARRYAETRLRRQLCTATWILRLDYFPRVIEVPLPPLVSVTTLTYTNSGGTVTTLTEGTHFIKDIYSEPGRVMPAYNQSWPSNRGFANDVALKFVAGYGTADQVPESIRYGIKLLVAEMWDKREPTVTGAVISKVPAIEHLLISESWGSYA